MEKWRNPEVVCAKVKKKQVVGELTLKDFLLSPPFYLLYRNLPYEIKRAGFLHPLGSIVVGGKFLVMLHIPAIQHG
jgi:hypothetical protein